LRLSRLLAVVVAAAAFAVVAPSAHAASNYFLKVEGLTGESLTLPGYIDIDNFAFGIENPQTLGSVSGGPATGKASFNELEINKWVDATTPAFFTRAASGQKIGAMELIARRAGATSAVPYLRYCFQTVFVTQQSTSGEDDVRESLKLMFGSVTQQYTKPAKDGSPQPGPAGTVSSSWSLLTNTVAKELWPTSTCTKAV
jgi:type VI secretion system secreted protein Hcp